jgi:hypothetical protein
VLVSRSRILGCSLSTAQHQRHHRIALFLDQATSYGHSRVKTEWRHGKGASSKDEVLLTWSQSKDTALNGLTFVQDILKPTLLTQYLYIFELDKCTLWAAQANSVTRDLPFVAQTHHR